MNARIRQLTQAAVGAAVVVCTSVSCGNVARMGRSPAMLIIDSLEGASGATPGVYGVPLQSDVITVVTSGSAPAPTYFNDLGRATLRIVLKDQGSPAGEASPSPVNSVTLSRYHISYVRADGRNTPGVDVPYPIDGGVTLTVGGITSTVAFEMVHANAKLEAPLRTLQGLGGRVIISTIADVTFYGKDLVGNDVQATGHISVNFADFGDPS